MLQKILLFAPMQTPYAARAIIKYPDTVLKSAGNGLPVLHFFTQGSPRRVLPILRGENLSEGKSRLNGEFKRKIGT